MAVRPTTKAEVGVLLGAAGVVAFTAAAVAFPPLGAVLSSFMAASGAAGTAAMAAVPAITLAAGAIVVGGKVLDMQDTARAEEREREASRVKDPSAEKTTTKSKSKEASNTHSFAANALSASRTQELPSTSVDGPSSMSDIQDALSTRPGPLVSEVSKTKSV